MREHRQSGKSGNLHGGRVIILIVLVSLVVVPIVTLFTAPASMQKFMDERCCWFLPRPAEGRIGMGKGPMPPSGVLKKPGVRSSSKKSVSFCEETAASGPPSRASYTNPAVQARVQQANLLPPAPELMMQISQEGALGAPAKAVPSAFASPIMSDTDLESTQQRPMPPRVLDSSGYGGEQRMPPKGQVRDTRSSIVR